MSVCLFSFLFFDICIFIFLLRYLCLDTEYIPADRRDMYAFIYMHMSISAYLLPLTYVYGCGCDCMFVVGDATWRGCGGFTTSVRNA